MVELNYVKELTLNFNLRKPTSKRPTNVYAVVKVCGKQIKIPTTAKINAYLWDSRKQLPMIIDSMSDAERDNAKQVFSIINSFHSAFIEYYNYLYPNFQEITSEDVRSFFEKMVLSELNIKKMAKNGVPNVKRERKATKTLLKAIDMYQSMSDKPVKDSTLKTYRYNLQAFIDYCADIKRDSVKMLTDKGLTDFENYLRSNNQSSNYIRHCLRILRILINQVIVKHTDFKTYGINKVSIELPKDVKEEGKKVELTDDEIYAIKSCENLTPTQKEYRDIFILECLTGQRASDVTLLFDSSRYEIIDDYYSILTKKETVPALIRRTPEVIAIIERYKDGFKHINIYSPYFPQSETIALKKIAKAANLNRIVSYKDNRGKLHHEPLYELISSHYGRHSFVTKKARVLSLDEIKFLTGHKDTQSLNKNYLHQTVDDRVAILNKAQERVTVKNDSGVNNSIDVLNDLFAYDMLLNIEHSIKNNVVFNKSSAKQAIEIMKNVTGLSNYPKEIDKEKVVALEWVIFELSYYNHDIQLYATYQYKEHYFGIIDKVASYDEVEAMFAIEDIERPKNQIQADIDAWENR